MTTTTILPDDDDDDYNGRGTQRRHKEEGGAGMVTFSHPRVWPMHGPDASFDSPIRTITAGAERKRKHPGDNTTSGNGCFVVYEYHIIHFTINKSSYYRSRVGNK